MARTKYSSPFTLIITFIGIFCTVSTAYFWNQWRDLEAVTTSDLDQRNNRGRYFLMHKSDQLIDSLKAYRRWGNDLERLNLEAERLQDSQERYHLFVDHARDTILVHREPEYRGRTNEQAGGTPWKAAFNTLRTEIFEQIGPDTIAAHYYAVGTDENDRRYGVFYYDPDRQWIYGLVVRRQYFEELAILQTEKIAVAGLLWSTLLLIMTALFVLYYLLVVRVKDERRKEYERALEHSEVGFAVLDLDSTVLTVNEKFRKLYTSEKYQDKKLLEVSTYATREERQRLWDLCLKGKPATYRNSGRVVDNRKEVSAVTLTRYGDRVVMTTSDVSDIVYTYGIVGHDLRNRLAASNMGIHRLMQHLKNEDETVQTALLQVREVLLSTENYAMALETWGQQEAGNILEELKEVDLVPILREVKELFAPVFALHGTEAEFSIGGDLRIYTSPRAVMAVLRNLLANAMTAFLNEEEGRYDDHPKAIRVLAEGRDGEITLSVWDSGSGMTERIKARMNSDDNTALGFGSRIIRKYVKKMAGGWEVTESSPTSGTTITITLPQNNLT